MLVFFREEYSMAAMRSVKSEITQENRKELPVVQRLQRQMANAFVLYSNYKRLHWQTYGPLFRDLHKMSDEFAEEVLPTIEEIAERVRIMARTSRPRS